MSGTRSRLQRRHERADAKTMRLLERALRDTTHAAAAGDCGRCGHDDAPRPVAPAVRALRLPALEPLAALAWMVELRDLAAQMERAAVAEARQDGHSWATVGQALGVSGQAVSKKYGP